MTTHWPPVMELDPSSRQITGGQVGNQLKLIMQRLGNYEHATREMRWNRFWFFVEKGEKLCNCMVYKTPEREAVAQFSIPVSLTLPNRIVMGKDTYERIGSPASLSIVDIITDKRFRGLLIKKRSYSTDIDRILAIYKGRSNITRCIIDEQTYIKMLAMKRVDYILEYPFVIRHTLDRHFPEFKGRFVLVPITEIAPFYYVYIACPKNEWGRALITDINAALNRLRPMADFRREVERLYTGDELDEVRVYYNRHLLSITQ
ncbi:MAG: hypothetical protein HUN04_07150 [Desulfobacter sp.]|nr:MAG: hypothetical protein HUN04_07150 [Desulfobacter sp.]